MKASQFGFHDADFELARREAARYERQQEEIEFRQNIFDEWAELQSRIPGSGVYHS